MPKVIVEVVGDNESHFRQMEDTDLRDIARTYTVDVDLKAAHDSLWNLSEPVWVQDTGGVDFIVIDDSKDVESCKESWMDVHEEFEEI